MISVASNLIPNQMKALIEAALQGNGEIAKRWHYLLLPFFKASFIETNPIPIKAAMNLWEMAAGPCRLPLCELDPKSKESLESVLETMKKEVLAES